MGRGKTGCADDSYAEVTWLRKAPTLVTGRRDKLQLIDAENGSHLWAARFATDRASLGEAENEITGRLARTLNLELIEDVGRRIERERPGDLDAQDLVMRGRALFNRPYSAATLREALLAYEQALEKDPESIEAKIGIA